MAATFSWVNPLRSGLWADRGQWQDGGGLQGTPGIADTAIVFGPVATRFKIVAGPGAALTGFFVGNTAVQGAIAPGKLIIGLPTALTSAPAYTDAQSSDILAGSVVTAQSTAVYGNVEVNGAGAALRTAKDFSTLDGGSAGTAGETVVVNGGTLQAGSLTMAVGDLIVDPTATVEVGTAGGVARGVVTIDPGATLALTGRSVVKASIVDNGTLSLTANGAQVTGGVAGSGTVQGGSKLVGTIDGDVSGLAAMTLADNGSLLIKGGVANVASIVVGADASLGTGRLANVGGVGVGARSTLTATGIAGGGPITLAADAALVVQGDVSGAQAITVGTRARATLNGTVSGLSGISLASGARLDLGGDDTNVPVALAGLDEIDLLPGHAIGGAVTGFDGTDVLKVTSDRPAIVNRATWSNGTLSLASGTAPVATVALAGAYAGQVFIPNVVGGPVGETTVVVPNRVVKGLGTGAVSGSSGRAFTLVTGGGASGAVTTAGNLALQGAYTAGSVVIGNSSGDIINPDAVDLLAGSTLAVTGAMKVQGSLGLVDSGSTLTVGGQLTIGFDRDYSGEVLLLNGARLQAGSLFLRGAGQFLAPSRIGPDALDLERQFGRDRHARDRHARHSYDRSWVDPPHDRGLGARQDAGE